MPSVPGGVIACIVALGTTSIAEASTVTVVDGIPGYSAKLAVDGHSRPGQLLAGRISPELRLSPGRHTVTLTPTTGPRLTTSLAVPADGSVTVVAHLDANAHPTLSVFRNRAFDVAPGEALLAIRQTAAAPTTDVLVDGRLLFRAVLAGGQRAAAVPVGLHRIGVRIAPLGRPVVLGSVRTAPGRMTVVYVLGAVRAGTLQALVQSFPARNAAAPVDPGELWQQFPLERRPPSGGGSP